MIDLSQTVTELQSRINALTNASSADDIFDLAITAANAEVVGVYINRTPLDAQLQRLNNLIGSGTGIEDLIALFVSVQKKSTSHPVGTVIDNYLNTNDLDSPNWVKLGKNVTADISVFPKLENMSTQGALTFAQVAGNNLAALLLVVAGNWVLCDWGFFNGLHVVIARDTDNNKNFYRTFTSADGVQFTEKGMATAAAPVVHNQSTMYLLNGKLFIVSPSGVFESSDLAVTWVRKTSNYYYSMGFHNGLYVFGGSSDLIATSTDLATFTNRHNSGDSSPITNIQFMRDRWFAFKYSNSGNFNLRHSVDGINWTALNIASYTHPQNLGYCHGVLLNNKIIYIADGQDVCIQSEDGLTNWVKIPTISSNSYYGQGAIVAGDTLYGKNTFTSDTALPPRNIAGHSSGSGSYHADNSYIFHGNLSTTTLTLYKFPVTNNANKVYLPNLENKMMRVR